MTSSEAWLLQTDIMLSERFITHAQTYVNDGLDVADDGARAVRPDDAEVADGDGAVGGRAVESDDHLTPSTRNAVYARLEGLHLWRACYSNT